MEEFKVPVVPNANIEVRLPVVNQPSPQLESTEEHNKDADLSKANESYQSVAIQEATCPYKIPSWSAAPAVHQNLEYKFEVLKCGQIIDEVKNLQTKAVWTFGRLPSNDIEMAHPTISRFHVVLQYKPSIENDDNIPQPNDNSAPKFGLGWYIYDLGSTHGTFLNKQRIPEKTYIRIQVGHMLRLGASTRCYILQGPSEDEEPESELSVTELRAQRQQQEAEKLTKAIAAQRLAEEREREHELAGVNWGMMEDADEETDLSVNPYASTNNEDLFLDDPKRTLRGFFEREGLDLVYKCDEMSAGSFICRVELPVDDSNGRPIVAEVVHKGRKKECVVQCALEACRILDRSGLLRQANQEPLKRKAKTTDSDDDDEFWDRTGDVERKKMRKAQTNADVTLTYDDLLKQEKKLLAKIEETELEISKYQEVKKQQKALQLESTSDDTDLDRFMQSLGANKTKELDKTEIRKLRIEELRLKKDHAKLRYLLLVAKPFKVPYNLPSSSLHEENKTKHCTITKQLPMIGKRNQFSKFKVVKSVNPAKTKRLCVEEEEEEEEEEEKEDDGEATMNKLLKTDALKCSEKNVVNKEISQELLINNNEKVTEDQTSLKLNTSSDDEKPAEYTEKSFDKNTAHTADPEDLMLSTSTEIEHCTETTAFATNTKKKRQRLRLRTKRADIEELAEHESTEKYAKWMPPDNQNGDGITELNEKYGY